MGKLAEWSENKPDWVKDALQRAGCNAHVSEENVNAVMNRVAIAHGLAVEGNHPCLAFDDASLIDVDAVPDDIVLCSVGPLQGLDRLVADQVLEFANNGITVIFGDNGAGKSGYTRAMRQLTRVREEAVLEGNVFDSGPKPKKTVTFSYRKGGGEKTSDVWQEGEPKPSSLAGITLLDTDNLRVYVSGKNDILYMPPEAACVGRLAELYQAVAGRFRAAIDTATQQCSTPFGGGLKAGSSAAAFIARLSLNTTEAQLPGEEELRQNASWTAEHQAELEALRQELSRGPAVQAAASDRIAEACANVAAAIEANEPSLSDDVMAGDTVLLATKRATRQAADALIAEQIGSQPIGATGSDAWQNLFRIARQFAAEAGVRSVEEPFLPGDPCPLCQQDLDEEAAVRMSSFDSYIRGAAMDQARTAENAVAQRLQSLRGLSFKSSDEIGALLAEAAAQDTNAKALVSEAIAYNEALRARRDERLGQFEATMIGDFPALPINPVVRMKAWATQLREYANQLRNSDDRTAVASARVSELESRHQLSNQIEEAVVRRNQLASIHLWKKCEDALGTRSLSLLMSALRKELTSPALEARIKEEIANFGMEHVPLRFTDATDHGTSVFEVGLATDQAAKKARILSEGEQRALSLACFMAETHVAERRSGIILDDPVTSLDHMRIRKVARRLVDEAAKGRQIIIFTHNLVFYNELMLACTDRTVPVPALPCLIEQGGTGEFGVVTVDSAPWVARKVKEREQSLKALLDQVPEEASPISDEYRRACTRFYAALRETWERAVEEIVLNDVVRRFGSNVGTLRLSGVDVSDEDYLVIHRAMSRASEHSGHDQAAAKQIEMPTKTQMQAELDELAAFRAKKSKANKVAEARRKGAASKPPKAAIG